MINLTYNFLTSRFLLDSFCNCLFSVISFKQKTALNAKIVVHGVTCLGSAWKLCNLNSSRSRFYHEIKLELSFGEVHSRFSQATFLRTSNVNWRYINVVQGVNSFHKNFHFTCRISSNNQQAWNNRWTSSANLKYIRRTSQICSPHHWHLHQNKLSNKRLPVLSVAPENGFLIKNLTII